tara:strand:+ start:12625 stop:12843 length:219 start_codon:yes stop_codon:yes gene_type:complete
MEGRKSRKQRAALLRKEAQNRKLFEDINNHNSNKGEIMTNNCPILNENLTTLNFKRTRMQNAKGTTNMFIKP